LSPLAGVSVPAQAAIGGLDPQVYFAGLTPGRRGPLTDQLPGARIGSGGRSDAGGRAGRMAGQLREVARGALREL
jgi:hypothetical protein